MPSPAIHEHTPKKLERKNSVQPLYELADQLILEAGVEPRQRLDWLLIQSPETFGDLLVRINGTARGISEAEHGFDGEGVQAGTVGGSVPPDQADKVDLLGEMLNKSQKYAQAQLEKGEEPQAIMQELAMVMPVVVNKLHLFRDGNGRTSRFLRMFIRDGDQLSQEKIDGLVGKKMLDRYDTTPAGPVERSLLPALQAENGTAEMSIDHNIFADTDGIPVREWEGAEIARLYPTLSPSIRGAYDDTGNFSESIKMMAKAQGLGGEISLKPFLHEMTQKPELQEDFIPAYRSVRKQRVELLMEGLLGEKTIPLGESTREDDIKLGINMGREIKGWPPIDPNKIRTVQEFQMASMETCSPERTQPVKA